MKRYKAHGFNIFTKSKFFVLFATGYRPATQSPAPQPNSLPLLEQQPESQNVEHGDPGDIPPKIIPE